MSEKRTMTVRIHDRYRLKRACDALRLECRVAADGRRLTAQLYGGQTATGVAAFRPRGWKYECVLTDEAKGLVEGDDFEGRWGDAAALKEVEQHYAALAVIDAAQQEGLRLEGEPVREADGTLVYELVD